MAIDVSYIVPVYNALPNLEVTVDSLVNQSYDPHSYEVVFVDDGSTDGSGPYLDGVSQGHDNVQVVHIEASGGPSTPRNVGLSVARGEFVFFCDADDWMEPDATARMVGHAHSWNPDVMLVKPKGEGGRRIAAGAFNETLPEADVYTSNVGQSLGPCKLFRRAFLEEQGLSFSLNLPVWEDQPFALAAYLLADRVSVAADGVYCHWRASGETGSSGARNNVAFDDVVSYLTCMMQLVEEHGDVDAAKHLIIPRVLREGLFYAGRAYSKLEGEDERRARFADLHTRMAPYFSDGVYRICNAQRCLMYQAFVERDADSWAKLCAMPSDDERFEVERFEVDADTHAVEAVWADGGVVRRVDARGMTPLDVVLDRFAWQHGSFIVSGVGNPVAFYGSESAVLRLIRHNCGTWVDVPAEITGEGELLLGEPEVLEVDVPAEIAREGEGCRFSAAVSSSVFEEAGRAASWDVILVVFFANGRTKKQRIKIDGQVGRGTLGVPVRSGSLFIMPHATKGGALRFADYLLDATVSVNKKFLGSTIELKGVPNWVFKAAGGIDVVFAKGDREQTVRFTSNGKQSVGFNAQAYTPVGLRE